MKKEVILLVVMLVIFMIISCGKTNDNPVTQYVGWAIGQDANNTPVIVHTADSGLTWQVQGDWSALTGLQGFDISSVDDQTAWAAIGSGSTDTRGYILHTTDGGATWVTQTIPAGLVGGIKGVKGVSRNEAWAASLGGAILHTTDGATWNVVPQSTAPITQVNRMDVIGTNVWIADFAAGGAVVHTQDGGITWRAEYLPNGVSPLTVHAFSPLAVWVSGSEPRNATFYRTVNGGDLWDKVILVGANDHLDDVCAASPDDAWGVMNGGVSGKIWRVHVSADGIPEAKNVSPPELLYYSPGGITCMDKSVAWVVAKQCGRPDPTKPSGIILHTVDGEHWLQQTAPAQIRYWKVSFVGARR